MNSEESFLKIRIFYKDKSFDINSKDLITLKEIEEKSIKYFKINAFMKKYVKFFVKENKNDNDDKIFISSEDDIIKNSIEKDPQNLLIELQLTTDDIKGTKIKLKDEDIDKNRKSIIDNNIKNEKEENKLKINCIECKDNINELNKEIKKYKDDYLKLEGEIQNLKKDLNIYKEEINNLKKENSKLLAKLKNSNKNLEIVSKKKENYIKELEEKIKEYVNNSIALSMNSTNKTKKDKIEKVKVVDISIQSSQEKSNFNNKDFIIISKSKLGPIKEESSPIPQNNRYSSYNDNNDIKLMNSIDDEILGKEQNLNDNSINKNIELFTIKNNKEKIFLSRNEEIKKENNESNFNPKTEIKKIRGKKYFNFEEKKFDISSINIIINNFIIYL